MRSRLAAFLLLACIRLGAEPTLLDNLVPADAATRLRAGEELGHVFKGKDGLALFPDLFMRSAEAARVANLEPTAGVEFLVLYRPPNGRPPDPLRAFNSLHALSKLAGIEYFSASRNRMRVFFVDASLVEGPDSTRRIADPVTLALPADGTRERRYAFLDDSSLGKYTSRIDYVTQGDTLTMSMGNAADIRKLLVSFVGPEKLAGFLAVTFLQEGMLFYGFSCIRTIDFLGIVERKAATSFRNRLEALYAWFRSTYEASEPSTK